MGSRCCRFAFTLPHQASRPLACAVLATLSISTAVTICPLKGFLWASWGRYILSALPWVLLHASYSSFFIYGEDSAGR